MSQVQVTFIPPEQFATKRWWRPARPGAAWFYHTPAPFREARFMRDYSTVDPFLRPIVQMMHGQGIPTMPSCEGHWPDKKWSQRCFEALEADATAIRFGRFAMLDVENGARCEFSDPYWELPWFSWQDMHDELLRHKGQGYLCFPMPANPLMGVSLQELDRMGPEIKVKHEILHRRLHAVIEVQAQSPMAQHECWKRVKAVLSHAR